MSRIFSSVVKGAKSLFLSQVLYLDKQCYQFNPSAGFNAVLATSRKILVVSRHGYTEQIQWLPVGRRNEAKKLVKYQKSTRGGGCFYVLGQPLNGKIPVIWYQMKPEVMQLNALLYLPETLLLARQSVKDEVLVYQSPDHNKDIFVTCTHAGAVSAVKGGILQSAAQFMLAQGSEMQKCDDINPTQLPQHLLSTLFNLQRIELSGLINKSVFRRTTAFRSVSRYIWPLAASFTLYLLLAGGWAQHQQQSSREQLQQANSDANQLLLQRENINSMISRYQQLTQVLPESDDLLQLWQVLAPLYQQDVIVSNVQQRQQQVTVRIEAASATVALQLLVQQPGVTRAQVEGNVRRQNNRDVATVSFQLQETL